LERLLNVARGAGDIQQQAMRVFACHRQAMRFGKCDHCLVICLGRAELFCELLRRQVMPVIWACGIRDVLQQASEPSLIAHGQADSEVQGGGRSNRPMVAVL
jgi:hypothetical protein